MDICDCVGVLCHVLLLALSHLHAASTYPGCTGTGDLWAPALLAGVFQHGFRGGFRCSETARHAFADLRLLLPVSPEHSALDALPVDDLNRSGGFATLTLPANFRLLLVLLRVQFPLRWYRHLPGGTSKYRDPVGLDQCLVSLRRHREPRQRRFAAADGMPCALHAVAAGCRRFPRGGLSAGSDGPRTTAQPRRRGGTLSANTHEPQETVGVCA
mmetsp:Transcript_39068/g.84076  ORF Transcript_39068/g.84076 Transcript_39068/m.84076 type:complete len:214 (+) Transcript_39068:109-750(+)